MRLNEIKQSIQELKARYAAIPLELPFREKVCVTYSKQTLNKLESIVNQHEEDAGLLEALQDFLVKNRALVNHTSVGYTSRPDDEVTLLLCDIAQHIADEKKLNALEVLMPGVAYESFRGEYEDLTQDVKSILKTHVLGDDGQYLLPVKLITELNLSPDPTQLGNPYYDFMTHTAEQAFVGAEEYKRLVEHSPLTQAVFNKKHEYELLSGDVSTLLGQLKQLCQQLSINMAGNLGKEANAGGGAYPAIIHFIEYYKQLESAEKEKIPENLNQEINKLYRLVSDAAININATESMETCIATRRSAIITAMSAHDESLNQITVSGAQKASLMTEARAGFDATKHELTQAIQNNNYTEGHEAGSLNIELLKALGLEIKINALSDLDIIKSLTPHEITAVCENSVLRRQIALQLRVLGNLVVLAVELSPEKLTAFVKANRDEILQAFIESHSDVIELLIVLDTEKCGIFLDAIKEALPRVIKGVRNFGMVMRELSPEQRTVFFDAMKDKLPYMIESSHDFSWVMKRFSPEQRLILFSAFKADAFFTAMECLPPAQRTVLFDVMKERLPDVIDNGNDFAMVMDYLLPDQRTNFADVIKNKLPDIIHGRDDFVMVRKYLSTEQFKAFAAVLKPRLSGLIASKKDVDFISEQIKQATSDEVSNTKPEAPGFKERLRVRTRIHRANERKRQDDEDKPTP